MKLRDDVMYALIFFQLSGSTTENAKDFINETYLAHCDDTTRSAVHQPDRLVAIAHSSNALRAFRHWEIGIVEFRTTSMLPQIEPAVRINVILRKTVGAG